MPRMLRSRYLQPEPVKEQAGANKSRAQRVSITLCYHLRRKSSERRRPEWDGAFVYDSGEVLPYASCPSCGGVRAAVLVARHPGPFPVRRFWVPRQEETRDHALDGPRVPEVHPAHHAHVHDGGHLRRHRRRLRRPCRRRRRACGRQRGIPARVPYPGGGNGPWHGRRRDQLHCPRQGRGGALAAHRRRHLVHARGGLDPHLGAVFPVRRAAVPGAGRPR